MVPYEITVQGLIDIDWSLWYTNMEVMPDASRGVTLIRGRARDQAELYGVIHLIRDLNLVLLKLEQIPQE
jgi:hypothetical protein